MTREELEAKYNECQTTDDYVAVAKGAIEIGDKGWAVELVEEAAEWATLADELVLLAGTAMEAGAGEVADRLFGQAKDYCMSPDEIESVAAGAWKAGRSEMGRELFGSVADKLKNAADLLALAKRAGEATGDASLAAELEEKALGKCDNALGFSDIAKSVAAAGDAARAADILEKGIAVAKTGDDFGLLAKTAGEDLGNAEKAKAILSGAESVLTDAAEFAGLGVAAKTVAGDAEMATGYFRKAIAGAITVPGLLELAGKIRSALADTPLIGEVMAAAEALAETREDMLQLADATMETLGDTEAAVRMLAKAAGEMPATPDRLDVAQKILGMGDADAAEAVFGMAEEVVESGDDFRKLAEAARELVQDAAMKQALAEQLALREAHPDAYSDFLKAEQAADSPGAMMKLAARVMKTVGDRHYTARLYRKAEVLAVPVDTALELAGAIHADLGDTDWVKALLEARLKDADDDRKLSNLLTCWAELIGDTANVQEALKERESRIASSPDALRLARMVADILEDADWAAVLLDTATTRARNLSERIQAALLAGAINGADAYRTRMSAVIGCATRKSDFFQLVTTIRKSGADAALLDAAYSRASELLQNTDDLVAVAEMALADGGAEDRVSALFEKAESRIESKSDANRLFRSVNEKLGDRAWVDRLRPRL